MKLIHFADLHIGVENYGRPDPDTGMSTRLLDFLSAYDEMVQYAIDNRVDAVLFAGDAYKNRDPSQTHQREFAKRIAHLASEGIAVFLVTGNHDLPAVAGRASALEIFPTLAVERVHVSDRIETTLLRTRSGPLQVVSLPWIRRSRFLSRDDTRNLTIDQITQRLQERLTYNLTWELQNLKPNIPAVLVGHVTVSGSRVGTERSMMLGRDHVLLLSTLSDPSLDYVALGHIHKYQVLGHNPMTVYSGSLQRVDFSEETETKGFCVLEIDLDTTPRPASRQPSTSSPSRPEPSSPSMSKSPPPPTTQPAPSSKPSPASTSARPSSASASACRRSWSRASVSPKSVPPSRMRTTWPPSSATWSAPAAPA